MSIHALGINERLVKAVQELGFTKPTAIQEKAIPILLAGTRDFIGLAQTGTGKTAAFGLPMLHRIDTQSRNTQALILCPTRELCLQITQELKRYAQYIDGLQIAAIYGGANINDQIKQLKSGSQIVVGTPGRVIDHLKRRTLSLQTISMFVLDEADQMLDMGFQEDLDTILEASSDQKNVWLFSATMEGRIEKIAQKYMRNPEQVTVGTRNSSASNITHQYCAVKRTDMYAAVRRFIDFSPGMFGILFCRTRSNVQEIAKKLMRDGYNVEALHGDLSQAQRDAVMHKFRNKHVQLLVATDVAARGIDVDSVTHVMHYGLPDDIENYTHRSGRTARAGKSGFSIIICSGQDKGRIKFIERTIGKKIELILVPKGDEICQKQLLNFSDTLRNTSTDAQSIKPYIAPITNALSDLSKEDLIQRMFTLSHRNLLDSYAGVPDIGIDSGYGARHNDRSYGRGDNRSNGRRFSSYSGPSDQHKNRLFINLGKIDGMGKGELINFICRKSEIRGESIGKIVLQDRHSWVSITDDNKVQNVIRKLHGVIYNGRKLRVEMSGPQ